ncbi:hypothetical protein ACVW19_004720 [Streptomyces sp. TE5632]
MGAEGAGRNRSTLAHRVRYAVRHPRRVPPPRPAAAA